jgi:hypothetical protein
MRAQTEDKHLKWCSLPECHPLSAELSRENQTSQC